LRIDGGPDHSGLEVGRAVDGDAVAVAFHRQPQRGLQALARGLAGNLQPVAIVAHGRAAGAVDDRALLRDVVDHGGMARHSPALAADGIALEPLGGLSGPQGGQRLVIALGGLMLEPIGPGAPAVGLVQRLPFALVVLLDRLDFVP